MDTDGASDAFDVLLIKKDGTSEVVAHYADDTMFND